MVHVSKSAIDVKTRLKNGVNNFYPTLNKYAYLCSRNSKSEFLLHSFLDVSRQTKTEHGSEREMNIAFYVIA